MEFKKEDLKLVRIGFGNKIHIAERKEWEDGTFSYTTLCGCAMNKSRFGKSHLTVFDIEKINGDIVKRKLCEVSKIVKQNLEL